MTRKKIIFIVFMFPIIMGGICNDTCEYVNIGTVLNPKYVCVSQLEE